MNVKCYLADVGAILMRNAYKPVIEDLLAAEKYASGEYDIRVFEFGDAGVRNVLGAIQRQEQGHGKSISDYMKVNAMCPAA